MLRDLLEVLMLYRLSCQACHLTSIWTDDPKSFLQTVCRRYRHCEAKLVDESFASARVDPVPATRAAGRRRLPLRAANDAA